MQQCTAFPAIEQNLRGLIQKIDIDRFLSLRVPACAFLAMRCHGVCCSLLVGITQQEADVLTCLAKEKSVDFKAMGIRLPNDVAKHDPKTNRWYVTKRRRAFAQLNNIIHRLVSQKKSIRLKGLKGLLCTCVFATEGGACGLQLLAEKEGLHKWYYKPINCWKYPLSVKDGYLSVSDTTSNLYFPCSQDTGTPVLEGLKEELQFMGRIIGRDITAEIRAAKQ